MPNPKLETYKNKATNTVYDLTDADAQSKLTAILDGTDIDSFGDVESALADKVSKSATAGLLKNDGTVDTNSYLTSVPRATADTIGGIKAGGQYDNFFTTDLVSGRLEPIFHSITPSSEGSGFAASNDVYDAIDDVYKGQAVLGAKNRLNFDAWKGIATSNATATWGDNSLTLVATAANGRTNLSLPDSAKIHVNAGEVYKFTWEDGGSGNSAVFEIFDPSDTVHPLSTTLCTNEKTTVTVPSGCTELIYRVIIPTSGQTAIISKLMCTFASDTDPTFADYAMTNRELTEKVQGIIDAATNAADFAAFKTAIGNL